MSAMGQANIQVGTRYVRYTPESGHAQRRNGCPLSARSGQSDLRPSRTLAFNPT
jgi:hypothetical protein